MMSTASVGAALRVAIQHLSTAGCDTPQLDAELLLAFTLNQSRTWLLTYPEFSLNNQQQEQFLWRVERRRQHEPVAYIVGQKAFFGLDFLVTPDVLIPRPDTELLVETALEIASGWEADASPTIADVGTGSGCIAVSLAKNLAKAYLTAIDISSQALQVAKKNAAAHGVSDRIKFLQGDLLAPFPEPVNMIVSNPPYVSQPELQAEDMMPDVVQYEPDLALNGGESGLDLVEQLLTQATEKLKPGGSMLVEIGYRQGEAVKKLAASCFPFATVAIRQDLAGLDRLLVIIT